MTKKGPFSGLKNRIRQRCDGIERNIEKSKVHLYDLSKKEIEGAERRAEKLFRPVKFIHKKIYPIISDIMSSHEKFNERLIEKL